MYLYLYLLQFRLLFSCPAANRRRSEEFQLCAQLLQVEQKVEAESRPSSKILYKRRHKVKDNQNICILPILYANISMSVVSRQRQRNGGKGSDVALARTVLANYPPPSFSPPLCYHFSMAVPPLVSLLSVLSFWGRFGGLQVYIFTLHSGNNGGFTQSPGFPGEKLECTGRNKW